MSQTRISRNIFTSRLMDISLVGLSLVALSSTSRAQLFEVGTHARTFGQFSLDSDDDTDPSFSTASIVSSSRYPGTAQASSQYDSSLRVEAKSAPSGSWEFNGEQMSAWAEMTTLHRIVRTPGGPSDGVLVDVRMDYGVDGRMTDVGTTGSSGNMSYLIQLGRASSSKTLLNGFLFFNPSGSTPVNQDFGDLDPELQTDAASNTFIDVNYTGSSVFQVEVGEEFTVRALLKTTSGGRMNSSYLNTGTFSLTAVTEGVEVEVVPVSTPEPAPFRITAVSRAPGAATVDLTFTSDLIEYTIETSTDGLTWTPGSPFMGDEGTTTVNDFALPTPVPERLLFRVRSSE